MKITHKIKKNVTYFKLVIGLLFLFSCSKEHKLELDYSFEAAIDVNQNIKDFNKVNFKPFDNLNLGFHKGNVWIKLTVLNSDNYTSYMVMMDDIVNRNYRFYKLNTINNNFYNIHYTKDLTKQDHRTFNYPRANFKIDLKPNETATFLFSIECDGRILQTTPKLLKMEDFNLNMNLITKSNIVFFSLLGVIFLINMFLWSVLKNEIYFFYGLYILSSCIFYLHVEGYFYGLGFTNSIIDHFLFISIRIWILSAALFTSRFLELKITNPKFTNVIKWMLIIILGGSTLYQLIFFNSSISHLHLIDNLFGFIWIIVAIISIPISIKKRRLQAKYYLITFSFLLVFLVLGLIDSHSAIFPGDPLFYFKTGVVIEFIGFTYFIALIVKQKLNKARVLEHELLENQKELLIISEQLKSKSIKKTDLITIFNLLESSLSKDNEWENFKQKFKALDPNFLNLLLAKNSDLSKSEIRLLTLIRIGYSQKEIATMLNIAPDSVKKARQRVRKKLNIPESIKLRAYLLSLNQ